MKLAAYWIALDSGDSLETFRTSAGNGLLAAAPPSAAIEGSYHRRWARAKEMCAGRGRSCETAQARTPSGPKFRIHGNFQEKRGTESFSLLKNHTAEIKKSCQPRGISAKSSKMRS
jgi:hypothetical protein